MKEAGQRELAAQGRIRGRLPHVASYLAKREYGKVRKLLEAISRDLESAQEHKEAGT